MSSKSVNNITNVPLANGRTFIGKWDSVLEYATAVILVNSDKAADVTIYQSPDKAITYTTAFSTVGGTPYTKYFPISSPFIYFTLKNNSGSDMSYLQFEVIYRTVSVVPPSGGVASSVNIFDSDGNDITATSGSLNVKLTSQSAGLATETTLQSVENAVATKGRATLWSSATVLAGAVSSIASVSSSSRTLAIFGNTNSETTLTLQMGITGTTPTYYDTQYISVANGDFGFALPTPAYNLRLKSSAGCTISAYAVWA